MTGLHGGALSAVLAVSAHGPLDRRGEGARTPARKDLPGESYLSRSEPDRVHGCSRTSAQGLTRGWLDKGLRTVRALSAVVHTHPVSRFPARVRPVALKTVKFLSTPAAAVAALFNKVRLALLAIAVVAVPACSSSSDSGAVTPSGLVQNLTQDPAGQTIVTSLQGLEGTIAPASVEASGGQTVTSVSQNGSTFLIAFDGVVSPDDQVRFVGVSGLSDEWRTVTSSDSRDPLFSITGATQDTSDLVLGGDTISVQFYSGPRVLQAEAEDPANWTLSVEGTTLDLVGTSISLDNATQIATFTLGRFANLHASFTLSCNVGTVAATSVATFALTGAATGDTAVPAVSTVTQDLNPVTFGDEFGRVLIFDFDEPISPVFGALPANFTVVDHPGAQGLTMPTSVDFEAGNDSQLRVTFSRPVVPGLDQIDIAGLVDAHGNLIVPVTNPIVAGSTSVNAFTTVTFETVEGAGNDRVVASTSQALDPDTAANAARWTLAVGGLGAVDLTTQSLGYDLLTRTLTIDLDFDVSNGTTGDLVASGAVDVDGEAFSLAAPQALAAGDSDSPGVSSLTQNRVADTSGKTLDVTFTEDVDPTTATNAANYTFTPALTVNTASVVAGNLVRLQTDSVALPGDYTLTVAQAVSDPAGNDLGSAFGPAGFPSTDVSAPSAIAVSGTAVEGAENDQISVLFDDDMVPAEVQDVSNWTLESPIGTPVSLAGSTVTYSASGGVATLALDAPGATALVRSFDLQVDFSGMRDLGGNSVVATPITATVVGESNRPGLEAAFINAGTGDEVTLRFSEPMRRLTDVFDAVSNPAGVKYIVTDAATGAPLAPVSVAEVDGGLGVVLSFGAVIDPASTVDVVGLVDLAGNVLFPVLASALEAEVTDVPAISTVTFLAVEGTDNDQISVTFNHPMSAWGITSSDSYSCTDSAAGVVPLTDATFSFDGADTVTINLAAASNVDLQSALSYELTLEASPTRPLRTKWGTVLPISSASPLTAVTGDVSAGPSPITSLAIVDPSSTENAFVIFSESVEAVAAVDPLNYTYGGGTVATSAVLVDPRVVQVTFAGVTVAPANSVDVNALVVDTAGNASTGVVSLAVTADTTVPTITSSTAVIAPGFGGDYVDVAFDEALDPATATLSGNYVLTNGSETLRLLGVIHDSEANSVRLLVDDMPEGATIITTVQGIADFAGNGFAAPVASPAVAGGDVTTPGISGGVINFWWDAAGTTVDVRFSEDVDYSFAEVFANWSTSGTVTVTATEAIGIDHVRLTLSAPLGPGETVELQAGLSDAAGNVAGSLSIVPAD
jgi:hypothetical protein